MAIASPVTKKRIGRITTITTARMMGPASTTSFFPDIGPRLHFYRRPERQSSDGDGGTGRAVIAHGLGVGLVHGGVIRDIDKEHCRLGDLIQRRTLTLQ